MRSAQSLPVSDLETSTRSKVTNDLTAADDGDRGNNDNGAASDGTESYVDAPAHSQQLSGNMESAPQQHTACRQPNGTTRTKDP